MQRISVLSPLNWGLEGFMELFARGGDITTVYPYGLMLLGFFAISLVVSLVWYFFASGIST
jgi:ABC-2 type transport system permease protein